MEKELGLGIRVCRRGVGNFVLALWWGVGGEGGSRRSVNDL